MSFGELGIELEFSGKGINEKAIVTNCKNSEFKIPLGKEILSVDPHYFRPAEVDVLVGDPSKSKEKLGWIPEYDLENLIKDMIWSDIELFRAK